MDAVGLGGCVVPLSSAGLIISGGSGKQLNRPLIFNFHFKIYKNNITIQIIIGLITN